MIESRRMGVCNQEVCLAGSGSTEVYKIIHRERRDNPGTFSTLRNLGIVAQKEMR
jgi:hypothetical protein